ncbi:MAG: hypothetical protein QOI01_2151 [Mycobacterium sp.]|nr:hypothetical protein [Mycobacterium sp.]
MTQVFVGELAQFADTMIGPQLTQVINRLRRPVRIAVIGRDGVGRGNVVAALRRRGVAVVPPDVCEVCVLVIAEALKAEDLAAVRTSRRPVLIVLTKADLASTGSGGPLAVTRDRAGAIRILTATPTVPMVGLLAALESDVLDGDLVAALRAFVGEPPNLTSVDAFVGDPHSVGRDVRARLLERLDRFGIAHAILALAGGTEPALLPAHLARLGNLDEVMCALDAVSAPVRYRRLCTALAELRSLTVQLGSSPLSDTLTDLLAADVTVMAAMTAAVDVIEADGRSVDRGDTPAAHLDRAIRWSRYGRGPVNALHRRCSRDIVRGSLRLLDGASA